MNITEPGMYDAIANDDYHADPVDGGSLSFSGAKKLLPPYCPAIYRYEREHPVYKDTFDFGSAAHHLVLGDDTVKIAIIDADSWRTNAAKEQKEQARAEGKVPLLQKDWAVVEAMAKALLEHPWASQLLHPDSGVAEQSMFWQDDRTGVWRRGRLDWLPHTNGSRLIVPDYKTAASADPESFAKSAANYGYHQQKAWYEDGLAALGYPDPVLVFIAQEKEPPYLVSVVELDTNATTIGHHLNREAVDLYATCTATDTWPGYTDTDVALVGLPGWYENRFEEVL